MSSPKKLLEGIVEMIEGDLEAMREVQDEGQVPAKLDVRSAAKITRYSKALLEILSYEADERAEARKRLSKLTKEELDALAKKEGLIR